MRLLAGPERLEQPRGVALTVVQSGASVTPVPSVKARAFTQGTVCATAVADPGLAQLRVAGTRRRPRPTVASCGAMARASSACARGSPAAAAPLQLVDQVPRARGPGCGCVSKSRVAAECALASPAPTCPAWCGGQPGAGLGDHVVDDRRDPQRAAAPRRTPAPRRLVDQPERRHHHRVVEPQRPLQTRAARRAAPPPARAAGPRPSRVASRCRLRAPTAATVSRPAGQQRQPPPHGGRERVGLRQVRAVERGRRSRRRPRIAIGPPSGPSRQPSPVRSAIRND